MEGKVAVITGGASGIGAAISRLFHAHGARIVVASNQPREELDAFCLSLDADGDTAVAIHCDLSCSSQIDALVARAMERFGRIDVLVNSAGLFARSAIEDMEAERVETLVAVNLVAPMLLTRAAIPIMRKQAGGVILNIASGGAILAIEGTAVYAATKAGLAHFTRTIAGELAHSGIRINAIGPGPVRTAMIGFPDGELTVEQEGALKMLAAASRSPSGQALIDPSQIADIALFLASDAAAAIQGSMILADDGMSAVQNLD